MKKIILYVFIGLFFLTIDYSCTSQGRIYKPVTTIQDTLRFSKSEKIIQLELLKGRAFNFPTFAIWVENLEGKHVKTLFVTKSIASGIFKRGQLTDSTWTNKPGAAYRPAALPYWLHKKGELANGKLLPTKDQPYTDAITGATPKKDFVLQVDKSSGIPQKFRLLVEINQPWDWNEYWTNRKFPNDKNYKSSAQPSVIYSVTIDSEASKDYYLNPIGHGHFNGSDGELYTDLTSLTSALNIVYTMKVNLK